LLVCVLLSVHRKNYVFDFQEAFYVFFFKKQTSGLQFGVTFTSAFTMYFYIITRAKKRPREYIRSVIENGKKLRDSAATAAS